MTALPPSTDVLVVGAGPAGSSAAAWLARAGIGVVLVDAAEYPRDKTCGDGLTPRAIAELTRLGLEDWVRTHTVNQGLRAHGFGQTLELRWPGGSLPDWGSAVARTELDDHLRTTAIKAGAVAVDGLRAVDVRTGADGRIAAVIFERRGSGPDTRRSSLATHSTSERDAGRDATHSTSERDAGRDETHSTGGSGDRVASASERIEIACQRVVVADGVRSPLGKLLGRVWHRDTVYGVAGRSYVTSDRTDDPWISSHLELRGPADSTGARPLLSGYGWVFPLGTGEVNLGAGTLATAKRPADVAIKPLMRVYADTIREEFGLTGDLRAEASALLPMGGAVTGVAGPNWALIGDAAACVNPLNGEGIDYGLETGRLIAEVLSASRHVSLEALWPELLRGHYGESFAVARRVAEIATNPRIVAALGPIGMRSTWMMQLALRWMGNLVTDEDRDLVARIWRRAGRSVARRDLAGDERPLFGSR